MKKIMKKSCQIMVIGFAIMLFFLSGLNLMAEEKTTDTEQPSVKEIEPKKEKKLELGAGLFPFRLNHYRGSDQFKNYYFPIPYFSYESERIEAESSFVRGVLFDSRYLTLKLSISLGLSVESEENRAREGMPDIGYIVETGPMAVLNLWKSEDKKQILTLEFPLRKVFSTDITSVDLVGWFNYIDLDYLVLPHSKTFGWKLEFSAGMLFADKDYHNFFYGVEPEYAKPGREEYNATGGFSGYRVIFVGEKRFKDFLLMPFFRYDYLGSTVFKDSPLVKTDHFFWFGMGAFYLF